MGEAEREMNAVVRCWCDWTTEGKGEGKMGCDRGKLADAALST